MAERRFPSGSGNGGEWSSAPAVDLPSSIFPAGSLLPPALRAVRATRLAGTGRT
jgi:hypothetical protein